MIINEQTHSIFWIPPNRLYARTFFKVSFDRMSRMLLLLFLYIVINNNIRVYTWIYTFRMFSRVPFYLLPFFQWCHSYDRKIQDNHIKLLTSNWILCYPKNYDLNFCWLYRSPYKMCKKTSFSTCVAVSVLL